MFKSTAISLSGEAHERLSACVIRAQAFAEAKMLAYAFELNQIAGAFFMLYVGRQP
jgi:hypothetical protein